MAGSASWRSHPYTSQPYLWIDEPGTVFQARVNASSFVYPYSEVPYDGASGTAANIRAGMTVLFGSSAGADDLGMTYIREEGTATPLKIGLSPRGTQEGEIDLADNAYITVLDDFRVWAKQPLISSLDGGIGYFDEQEYQRTLSLKPLANGGADFIDFIDGTAVSVTFNAGDSTGFGGSLTTYSWDFGDGTPGTATASNAGTVTFPAGRRYVHLRVTDNQSPNRSTDHHILVAALNRPGAATQHVPVKVDSIEINSGAGGKELTAGLLEDVPTSRYRRGSRVMVFEEEWYAGQKESLAGASGREKVRFSGWMDDEPWAISADERGTQRTTTLRALDAARKLSRLRAAPVSWRRKNSGDTRWGEIYQATLDRAVANWANWLTTLSGVAPVVVSGTGSTWAFRYLDMSGGSLWEQAAQMCGKAAWMLTCDMNGIVRMVRNPLLIDAGSRTNDVIVALVETDYTNLTTQVLLPRIGEYKADGLIVSTADADDEATAYAVAYSTAPGRYVRGQGSGSQSASDMLFQSQDEANARIGHAYRLENNPYGEINFDLSHAGEIGIDPARGKWVTITLSTDEAAQRGLAFTAARLLPVRKRTRWEFREQGVVKTQSISAIYETEGTPAETDPPRTANQSRPISTSVQRRLQPDMARRFYLDQGIQNMAALCVNGLGRTQSFERREANGGPTWSGWYSWASLGVSGTVLQWCPNGYAYVAGNAAGWVVTSTGIYYATISGTTPSATLVHTFTNTSSIRSIDASFGARGAATGENTRVCVVSYEGTNGVRAAYSDDGITPGSFTEVTINSNYNTDGFGREPGCYVSPHTGYIYTSVYTNTAAGASSTSAGRYSTDGGATWGALSGLSFSSSITLNTHLHFPFADNASDLIAYYTKITGSGVQFLYRSVGTTESDESPAVGLNKYSPVYSRNGIASSFQNRLRMATVAERDSGSYTDVRLFYTNTGSAPWTSLLSSTSLRRCAISGDNGDIGWAWGVGVLYEFDLTTGVVDSRYGDLGDNTPGEVLAIAGW